MGQPLVPHNETYVGGIWFPSVTTITGAEEKPWLKAWYTKWGSLAERKVKVANAIGTAFHDCVEQYINTGAFDVIMDTHTSCIPRVKGMMDSFIKWANAIDGVVHETEFKVISHLYTYSGTLDAVGTFNGKPIVYDWKTSSRIYDDYELQLVAYAQAYKENKGTDIKQGIIVHVSKNKPDFKLTTRVFKLGKRALNKFLRIREMFDDIKEREKLDEETTVSEATGC